MTAAPAEPTVLTDGSVVRHPGWLPGPSGDIAAWVHRPADGVVRHAVLVCPPLGHEQVHAHRTVVELADALARVGIVALRFDYLGTGSSSGDESTPELVAGWQANVGTCIEFLGRVAPDIPISIVGIRAGALLAAMGAAGQVRGWVGWAPISRGRRYVRELKALHAVSARDDDDPGYLEAGGFRFSASTCDALSELDIESLSKAFADDALIVEPVDQPVRAGLSAALLDLGIAVDVIDQPDFAEMVAEPHDTSLPLDTIERIREWLLARSPDGGQQLDVRVLEELPTVRVEPAAAGVRDEFVFVPTPDGPVLAGVFSGPGDPERRRRAVLLSNAGSVHHAGPNRLYVEVARALSAAGVHTLRFDLRNLGDSSVGRCPDENHPYPETAQRDIDAAARWLEEQGFDDIAVAGLCSGAHAAFRSGNALQRETITHIVSINPLTFDFRAGMSLETPPRYKTAREAKYYQRAVVSAASWKRLLTGKTDLVPIISFLLRRLRDRVSDRIRNLLFRVHLRADTALEKQVRAIVASGRRLHFVFASTDPGLDILMREAGPVVRRARADGGLGIAIVPGGDHTFSKAADRRRAVHDVVEATRVPTELTTERIEGPDLWSQLAPVWSELLDSTKETSAYLSSRWMSHCLDQPTPDAHHTGLIWRDPEGDAVGCAVVTNARTRRGPLRISFAYLNGSGVRDLGCEHNDVLAIPRHRPAVTVALARELSRQSVDMIELDGVRARLFDELQGALGHRAWEGFRSEAPFVSLEVLRRDEATYDSVLSSNTRHQIRRSERLYAERFGPVEGRPAESTAEALAWFDEMLELHDARWSSDTPSGFLPEARVFHRRLLEEQGMSRGADDLRVVMYRLAAGEDTIGILHFLVTRRHVHFHQSGLRYDDDRKLKPGLVTHHHAVRHFVDEGAAEYDFLGGEPTSVRYKRSLSTDARALYWAKIPCPTTRMWAVGQMRRARDLLLKRQAD